MAQIETGKVMMTFARINGNWLVEWHSNIADFDAIHKVITKYDQPEPIINELTNAGFQVLADVIDVTDATSPTVH